MKKLNTSLADYHLHTSLCKHATGNPESYVQQALDLGLAEVGFSCHIPMPRHFDPEHRMEMEELSDYFKLIENVRKKFPDYPIRLGLEADFHPEHEAFLTKFLASYEFDYVLGSIHFIDKGAIDNVNRLEIFDNYEIEKLWDEYFSLWIKAVKSQLYDCMAHPDLIKKFGFFPKKNLEDYYQAATKACKECQVALEVSSAGLRAPVKEIYPARRFLEIAVENNINIVTSSDAHKPEEVGYKFDELLKLIQSVGYQKLVRFEKRNSWLANL